MNLKDTKSSEELRKEITHGLDRLETKVDRLKERMSPGQIIDDAVFYNFRGNPKGSVRYMKENPIGSSFLAIGTFLLSQNEGESYEQYLRRQGESTFEVYKSKASDVKSRIQGQVDSISSDVRARTNKIIEKSEDNFKRLKSKGKDLKNQMQGASDNLMSKVSDTSTELKDNVIDATESFKERARNLNSELDESISDKVQGIEDKLNTSFEDSNMSSFAYVSMGAGLGFAMGSLIPMNNDELSNSELEFDFSKLSQDLKDASNQSMSVFKGEILDTFKNTNLDIF